MEESPHVFDGVDRHAHAAHLSQRDGMVRVVPHLGGKIERHRQAGGSLAQ